MDIPSDPSSSSLSQPTFYQNFFTDKRKLRNIIIIAVMVLALPVALYLATHRQIFRPRADTSGPNVLYYYQSNGTPVDTNTKASGPVKLKIKDVTW